MKIDWDKFYDPEDLERLKIPLSILLIILLIMAFKVSGLGTKHYKKYDVVSTTASSDSSDVKYINYKKDVVKFSKDGIALINKKEEAIWTETFDLDSPTAEICGEYIAIANLQGNDVYIFNKDGKVSNTTMPYPINSIQVAEQGVFAVVLENKEDNYIQLYSKEGNLLAEIKTGIRENGHPISMALSQDGKRMVVSSIIIDGMAAKNTVSAYNFGSAGKKVKNHQVWLKKFDDMIIPQVEFMNNKTFCLFGDSATYIYSMGQKPGRRPKATIEFDTEINSIFTSDNYLGYICKNSESEEKESYTLKIYNISGSRILSKPIDLIYNKIRFDKNEIIAIGDYDCTILSMKGKEKFHATFENSLTDVIPTGKKRQYMVLADKKTLIIKLK